MSSIRIRESVRYRPDEFGGICYVPHRDDLFALTHDAFEALRSLSRNFTPIERPALEALRCLVELGIAESDDDQVVERSYSGPSLIGSFPELPTVSQPLVINCFATAWCPLLCRYCHADDLMTPELRRGETPGHLDNVLATARAIPALVAVVTGGDPLSAVGRTRDLIEGLASSKAIVMDTSGAGPLEELLPTLLKHHVHVRVSLDNALPSLNDEQRPRNPRVKDSPASSWDAARATISTLLGAGVPVTVQTVITSGNDQVDDWFRLREVLVEWGVRHWVLHTVVAGGKARKVEERALGSRRVKRLRPGPGTGANLWALVRDTIGAKYPIDIRCTDTDDRPNSVLLVASNGDLYTEGFARKGKVPLFRAGAGQPDRVQALMAHLDRFGHARRYLNWNPWFDNGRSIEEVCIPFEGGWRREARVVETEFKFHVVDSDGLRLALAANGFARGPKVRQRDEYYDSERGLARQNDYVIRIRETDGQPEVALKGPRFFSEDSASSRLEIEVPVTSLADARAALARKDLHRTWYLEKFREEFVCETSNVKAALDEVPRLGNFLELEGGLEDVRKTAALLSGVIGSVEKRNYRELAVETLETGDSVGKIDGLEFEAVSRPPSSPTD